MTSITHLATLKNDPLGPFLSHRDRCAYATTSQSNYKKYYIKWTGHEMFRRIKKDELFQINSLMCNLVDVQKRVGEIVHIFNAEPWSTKKKFTFKQFPFYAWKAFECGAVTKSQLSTMLIFHCAHNSSIEEGLSPPKSIPLFNKEGKFHPTALKFIQPTLTSTNPSEPFINDEQLEEFLTVMQEQPCSERQFLVVPKGSAYGQSISARLEKIGVKLLLDPDKAFPLRIVPSFTMMQKLLNIKFPTQAVQINVVFGLSVGKDLKRNGLEGTRDMLVPFPFVSQPDVADTYKASTIDFIFHDYYHAFIASNIPPAHRQLFINLAIFISKQGLSELIIYLVDMELSAYRADYRDNVSEDAIFWKTIALSINKKTTGILRIQAIDKMVDFLISKGEGLKAGITMDGLNEMIETTVFGSETFKTLNKMRHLSLSLEFEAKLSIKTDKP